MHHAAGTTGDKQVEGRAVRVASAAGHGRRIHRRDNAARLGERHLSPAARRASEQPRGDVPAASRNEAERSNDTAGVRRDLHHAAGTTPTCDREVEGRAVRVAGAAGRGVESTAVITPPTAVNASAVPLPAVATIVDGFDVTTVVYGTVPPVAVWADCELIKPVSPFPSPFWVARDVLLGCGVPTASRKEGDRSNGAAAIRRGLHHVPVPPPPVTVRLKVESIG